MKMTMGNISGWVSYLLYRMSLYAICSPFLHIFPEYEDNITTHVGYWDKSTTLGSLPAALTTHTWFMSSVSPQIHQYSRHNRLEPTPCLYGFVTSQRYSLLSWNPVTLFESAYTTINISGDSQFVHQVTAQNISFPDRSTAYRGWGYTSIALSRRTCI